MKSLVSLWRAIADRARLPLHTILSPFEKMLQQSFSPSRVVFLGYLLYVTVGWGLLNLPFAEKSTAPTSLDHLFTAMSAVSTTGLSTISVADSYTFWGQLIVLILIQLGGIGYVTLGSFIILSRKPDLKEVRAQVGATVFSLPASFNLNEFIRSVVWFTVAIETAGIVALYPIFSRAGDPSPFWSAAFHSVSAFCTAGFSLYNDSFMAHVGNFWLNLVIGVLSYLGAIGFIVCLDFWNNWTGKTKHITLTSRIIIRATFLFSLVGTLLLLVTEPSIQTKSIVERIFSAFFQTMTALTTVGFNTINIAEMSKASILLIIVLMIVGASPSGTGGGIKVTTISAILGVIRAVIRGENNVSFGGRPIPLERIWMAVASFGFYLFVLIGGVFLLDLSEYSSFEQIFFEAASALGTVGLSMGITSSLTALGKVVVILLMFIGRVGPVTFGTALFVRKQETTQAEDNDLAI